MKSLYLLAALTLFPCPLFANDVTVNLAVGPSAPASDPAEGIDKVVTVSGGSLSRRSGGEVLGFGFYIAGEQKIIPVQVSKLRLIGYSRSGQGKVLVHSANTRPALTNGTLDSLWSFTSLGSGDRAENHNGLDMLSNGDAVTHVPAAPLSIDHFLLTFEAFAHDDASVVIQVVLQDPPSNLAVNVARILVNPPGNGGGGSSSGNGDSGGSGGSSQCTFHPEQPGCSKPGSSWCNFHPEQPGCSLPGSSRCNFHPEQPGCSKPGSSRCAFHPEQPGCSNPGSTQCTFHPEQPGCSKPGSSWCNFHPEQPGCSS